MFVVIKLCLIILVNEYDGESKYSTQQSTYSANCFSVWHFCNHLLNIVNIVLLFRLVRFFLLIFFSLLQYFHRFFYLSVCLIIFCFHPISSAIWNENQISYTKKADFLILLKKRLRLSEIMWEIQFRNDWKWNDEFFGHFYTESKMQTIEMEINIRFQAFCSKFRGIWSALVWYWAMLVAKHILSFSFYITDVSTIHITYYVTLIIIIK